MNTAGQKNSSHSQRNTTAVLVELRLPGGHPVPILQVCHFCQQVLQLTWRGRPFLPGLAAAAVNLGYNQGASESGQLKLTPAVQEALDGQPRLAPPPLPWAQLAGSAARAAANAGLACV